MVDYLGHNIENNSPAEQDDHFKVVFCQQKVGIMPGPFLRFQPLFLTSLGVHKGSTAFCGYGAYRIEVSGRYPYSTQDSGMNFTWSILPALFLDYPRALATPGMDPYNDGVNTFRYEGRFTLTAAEGTDGIRLTYSQRVEFINQGSMFLSSDRPIAVIRSGEVPNVPPASIFNYQPSFLIFSLSPITINNPPDQNAVFASCDTCIMEYLPE
jgi:hypothetical protein